MNPLPPPDSQRSGPPARPRHHRLLLGTLMVLALLAGGWSLYWWSAAETLERAVSEAAGEPASAGGMRFVCEGRSITGFPLHLVLTCDGAAIVAGGLPDIRLGAVVASARLDNPQTVTADIAGPLNAGEDAAALLHASWLHGRLNLHFSGASLQQGVITIDKPAVTALGLPPLTADMVELMVRHDAAGEGDGDSGPDGSSTAALTITGGRSAPGAQPLDASFILAAQDGGRALAGQGLRVPPQGLPLELTRLSLRSGTAAIEARGDLSLKPDGLLDGTLDVRLIDPRAVAGVAAGLAPGFGALADPLVMAVAAFGRPGQAGGRPTSGLTITLSGSRAFVGFIPIGRLPPLPVGP